MPPFLIQNNKPVPMLSLRRVNQHHSRYHSICMFPCPSRSNKRYAFTQQSRRKLLAAINSVCLLSSEGISVRVHPPAFTIRRLSVGGTSLAVFVTAFYAIAIILCPIGPLVNPLSGQSIVLSVYFHILYTDLPRLLYTIVLPVFFLSACLDKALYTVLSFHTYQMR